MMFFKKIYARFWATCAGHDIFGNAYYVRHTSRGDKRWVLYRGLQDASKVPAVWHGWLHKTSDHPLPTGGAAWHKTHRPNLSGTCLRLTSGAFRIKRRLGYGLYYQSWKPTSRSL